MRCVVVRSFTRSRVRSFATSTGETRKSHRTDRSIDRSTRRTLRRRVVPSRRHHIITTRHPSIHPHIDPETPVHDGWIKHTHTANDTYTTNDDVHSSIHRSRPADQYPPPFIIHETSTLGRSVRSKSLLTRSHDPKSTRPNARWTRVHAVVVPYPRASSRRSSLYARLAPPREMSTTTTVRLRARLSIVSRSSSSSRVVEGRTRAHHSFIRLVEGRRGRGKGRRVFFHARMSDLAVDARRVRGVMTMCARVCSFG